jgi:hypothetical protein
MKPAAYDKDVLYAVRALFEGKASEGQQKRFMQWLMFNACHIGMSSFAASDRDMVFSEGERWIGLQIARMREPEALALITPREAKRARPAKAETPKE